MVLIGFMHYRKKPTNKAYVYAAVAKAEGAELLYFSPGAVDFQKRKINGYIYTNGEWINITSDFPDVICNVIGFDKEKQKETINKLQEEIPFTSYSIGSKATIKHGSVPISQDSLCFVLKKAPVISQSCNDMDQKVPSIARKTNSDPKT